MSFRSNLFQPLEPRRLFTVSSGFIEDVVGDSLRLPTAMVIPQISENPPILIAEKAGRILKYQNGILDRQPLITLDAATDGELGLLGIAVDKSFQRNKHVFVSYSYQRPGQEEIKQRVSRFYFGGDQLVSETVLLELPAWDTTAETKFTNVGGSVKFAFDGTLLISVGDGGKKALAGDLGSPFGKILRNRPDGSVPSNNPFATSEGWQKYVWAYGLRDPQIAVSAENGTIYINDSGEKTAEEINIGVVGGNYGWPTVEGGPATSAGSNPVGPVYTIPHTPANTEAIVGGHIGGGAVFIPGTQTFPVPYAGDYFFVDRDSDIVQVMDIDRLTPTNRVSPFATDIIRPVDIGYTVPGDLFVIAQGVGDAGGQLLRYRATGAPSISRQPAGATLAPGEATKLTVIAGGLAPLSYQWQVNGQDIPGATKTSLTVGPFGTGDDGTVYTVRVTNERGVATSEPAVIRVVAVGDGTDGGGDGSGGSGGDGGGSGDGDGSGGGGTGGGGSGGNGNPGPFIPPKTPPPMGPIDLLPLMGVTPFSAVGGTTAKVTVKVVNVGLDTARGAMTVRLHLSPEVEPAVGTSDPAVGQATVNIRIAPGKAKTVKVTVTWPDGVDGSQYLLASVDPDNTLPETNEANNVAVAGGATAIQPGFTDLRTLAGVVPTSAAKKRSLSVSLSNEGNRASADELSLVIWAVPKDAYDAGLAASEAPSVGTAVLSQQKRLTVQPGKSKTIKLKFALPEGLAAGEYVLIATAEGPAEANAGNNASVAAGSVAV